MYTYTFRLSWQVYLDARWWVALMQNTPLFYCDVKHLRNYLDKVLIYHAIVSYLQNIPFRNINNLDCALAIVFCDAVSNLYHAISSHFHYPHDINNYWVMGITAYNIKMLSKIREVTLVKLWKFIICKICGEIYLVVLISHKIFM